jgi:hypothetical protein
MASTSRNCVVVLEKYDKNIISNSSIKLSLCSICGCNVSYLPLINTIIPPKQLSLLNNLVENNSCWDPLFKQTTKFNSSNYICTHCSSCLKQIDEIKTEMDKMDQVLKEKMALIELKMMHHYGINTLSFVNGMDFSCIFFK